MEIGFVLHNLIFLVERFLATEATVRPLAATKSEARNPKPETNPNDQNSKQKLHKGQSGTAIPSTGSTSSPQASSGQAWPCFHGLEARATGAEKQRLSTMGRSCAFGTKKTLATEVTEDTEKM